MFSPFSCSTFSNCPVAFNTTGSQRHGRSPVSDTIGIPKSQFCPLVSCTMGNFSKMPNFALSHFKRKQDVFLSKIAFQKIGGFRIFTARKRKTTASQFFPAVGSTKANTRVSRYIPTRSNTPDRARIRFNFPSFMRSVLSAAPGQRLPMFVP